MNQTDKTEINERINKHEEKIDSINEKISDIDKRLTKSEFIYENFTKTVENVCLDIQKLGATIQQLDFKEQAKSKRDKLKQSLTIGIGIGVAIPICIVIVKFIATLITGIPTL